MNFNIVNLKKYSVVLLVLLCGILLASCSVNKNSNKEVRDKILVSVEEIMKKTNNGEEKIMFVSGKSITKDEFVYSCQFNACVLDSNYDSKEVIDETIGSYALVEEAKHRGIIISNDENDKIENLTQEYVDDIYDSYFPLESYKGICRMSYLENELANQIQEEIFAGKISVNDKNTKNLCKKFKSFNDNAKKENENWSDERKLEEMKKYTQLYNEIEESYVNCLIAKYLSVE